MLRWPRVFFTLLALFWLSDQGFTFFEGEGLLFFCLGIWLQKKDFNLQAPSRSSKAFTWIAICIILAGIKTLLAFHGFQLMGGAVFPLLLIMHKTVIWSALAAAWLGSDALVRVSMSKPWFVWLTAFSFIIYGLHAPLIAYGINAIFPLLRQVEHYRMITYFGLPLALLIFCVVTGAILRTTLPTWYSFLIGGRGKSAS